MTTPTAGPAGSPEISGLASAQAYASGMNEAYTIAATGAETFAAGLDGHGVDGPAVAAVDRAHELTAQAGAAWAEASTALARQTIVKEAYMSAPNAGDKQFVTDAAAVGADASPAAAPDQGAPAPGEDQDAAASTGTPIDDEFDRYEPRRQAERARQDDAYQQGLVDGENEYDSGKPIDDALAEDRVLGPDYVRGLNDGAENAKAYWRSLREQEVPGVPADLQAGAEDPATSAGGAATAAFRCDTCGNVMIPPAPVDNMVPIEPAGCPSCRTPGTTFSHTEAFSPDRPSDARWL